MTDPGVVGTRKQREEWGLLAATIRARQAQVLRGPARPQDPNAVWHERRREQDEWEPPERRGE